MPTKALLLAALCGALPLYAAEYVNWLYGTHPESGVSVTGKAISPTPTPYRKSVLIIEGFDLDDGTDDESDISVLEDKLAATGLKSALLSRGYTIVLVDLDQNWADLTKNAKAVGSLMQSVWNSSVKAEPISVVGLSMGGLVANLAPKIKEYHQSSGLTLSSSDQTLFNSWNFKSRLTVTFDSPHKGAYVPNGLKGYVNFFSGDDDAARQYNSAFLSIASQQMLLMPVSPTSKTNRADWQNYYNGYLGFMKSRKDHRSAGIVKGSWKGDKQFTSNLGVKVIDWHYDPDWCGEAWANMWTQGRTDKKVGSFALTVCVTASSADYYDPPETYPNFENAPGGYLDGWGILAESMPNSPVPTYSTFAFIPSFSAAALNYETFSRNDKDNFVQNEATMGPMVNYSGLHHIYTHTGVSQSHQDLNAANGAVILQELQNAETITQIRPVMSYLLLDD
jgi:hypothetical protein